MPDKAPLPLAGITVLDVTQVMAGPFCTMLLADLGANVIKIEPPDGGDATRASMGFKMKGSDSMGYLNLNRNKRSVTLNLKNAAGKAVFMKLAAKADVVVENFRPGVVKKLGIDYDTLSAQNPKLVYCSISGFGQTGPWSQRPGFDLIAQAMSGIMSITGHPGGEPVKAGVPVTDLSCALFATYAILAAYIGAKSSGKGQLIDASLIEAGMALTIWNTSEYWGTGKVPQPLGTAHLMSAPYQAFKAADGYFVLGATSQKLWKQLCDAIGRADLVEDARFADISKRLANRLALVAEMEKTFAAKTAEEWVVHLLAAGIPAGRMNSIPEAFENEHAQYRQMRLDIDHPVEGKVPNIGFPVKLMGTPQEVRRHPPLLGEHNDEVLTELGLGGEIEDLRRQGAFEA